MLAPSTPRASLPTWRTKTCRRRRWWPKCSRSSRHQVGVKRGARWFCSFYRECCARVFHTATDICCCRLSGRHKPPHVPATACPRCSHRDARSVVSPTPPSTPHSATLAPRSSISTSNNLHSHSASFLRRRNRCALPCQPIMPPIAPRTRQTNHQPDHLARLLAAFSWCSTSIVASSAWGKYRCTFDGSPVSRCWT